MRQLLGSTLFWLFFVTSILVYAPLVVLSYPLPYRWRYPFATGWARLNLRWLKLTCGLGYHVEYEGELPKGSAIVFSKHQSTWETLALQEILPAQVWVLKRELLWIPFFGWGLAALEPIAIDRGAGRQAVQQLVTQGIRRLERGRWVVIFPEGTRVPPGKRVRYRIGGAVLAEKSGYPVVPVAHNAGVYWPKHRFLKRPGTIRVVVGKAIDTHGKSATEILQEAENWIESRVAQMSGNGRNEPK